MKHNVIPKKPNQPKTIRLKYGINRKDLSRLVNVHYGTLNNIEKCEDTTKLNVSVSTIRKIANYFGISIEDYLGF